MLERDYLESVNGAAVVQQEADKTIARLQSERDSLRSELDGLRHHIMGTSRAIGV